jgi:hypothetical protein
MRAFRWLGLTAVALLLGLAITSPVLAAAMAVIETVAPLTGQSDEAVKAAVLIAVAMAARGAEAMGLPQIAVNGVRVLPDMVIVQILATAPASGEQESDDEVGPPTSGQEASIQDRL